jgi:hypothetical protein
MQDYLKNPNKYLELNELLLNKLMLLNLLNLFREKKVKKIFYKL